MRRASLGLAFAIAWAALAGATPVACLHAQGSASVSASADSDPRPSAPDTVTAVALSETEVVVAWSAVTDAEGGVDHYRVYRDGERVGSATLLTFTDTGLEPGTTYEYRVSAVDSKQREGAKSDPVTVTTLGGSDDDDDDGDDGDDDGGDDDGDGGDDDGDGGDDDGGNDADATPPTAPSDLQAEATAPRRVELSWAAASDPESGVAFYRVYRDGVRVGSPSGTSFVDAGVEPETAYEYEVSAVNGDGLEGPRSERAAVTTPAEPDTTPPAPPSRLRIIR